MEAEFLRWLSGRLGVAKQAPLGLTDDAALLLLEHPNRCVLTTDLLMDGIDFETRALRSAPRAVKLWR